MLLLLECMKTEIPTTAPRAGVAKAIRVSESEVVAERQVLVLLDGE